MMATTPSPRPRPPPPPPPSVVTLDPNDTVSMDDTEMSVPVVVESPVISDKKKKKKKESVEVTTTTTTRFRPPPQSQQHSDDDDDDNDDNGRSCSIDDEEMTTTTSATTKPSTLPSAVVALLQDAQRFKDEGNVHFGQKQYNQAAQSYQAALQVVLTHQQQQQQQHEQCAPPQQCQTSSNGAVGGKSHQNIMMNYCSPTETTEKEDEWHNVHVALRSNLAIVLLRMERYDDAEQECTKALDIDPDNAKVWYRRALAKEGRKTKSTCSEEKLKLLQSAVSDLVTCLQLFPPAAAAQSEMKMNGGGTSSSSQKMRATAQEALDRLELLVKKQQQQQSAAADNAATTSTTTTTQKDGDESLSILPSPQRQRQDVIRLLMARQVVAQQQQTEMQSSETQQQQKQKHHVPLYGEAYFLLNWSWWSTWCHAVDFFYTQQEQQTPTIKNNNGGGSPKKHATKKQNDAIIGKRQLEVLRLLPPGATIPSCPVKSSNNKRMRKTSSCNVSSSFSDDDSEDDSEKNEDMVEAAPGVIDNSSLLLLPTTAQQRLFYQQWKYTPVDSGGGNDTQQQQQQQQQAWLRPNLIRGYHYEVLPREVYFALRVWYGEVTPSICRRAVKSRSDDPARRIVLSLYPEHKETGTTTTTMSQQAMTTGQFCGACRAPSAKARCKRCLAIYYCDRGCQESHWSHHKLACRKLAAAAAAATASANNNDNNNGPTTTTTTTPRLIPHNNDSEWGRVGLHNLGNTCFMNSAIQCLSHATPLTRHFLSNRFRKDLNGTNPLGTGGKLANAYDIVMKDIWMGSNRGGVKQLSTSPTALKRAIAMFAPRFAGCSQHDAQEFLAYLLDGLHEDLNRIRKAPYVEMPDVTDGQNMAIAGAEAWDAHRRRNDSLVMDTFYGQFKSTCVCPRCDRVSVSFDAFNHVSLEIPQFHNMTRTIPVLLFRSVGTSSLSTTTAPPTRYGVTVRRCDFVGDLRRALSELCQIPTSRLAVCDVYEHAIYEILQDGKPLSSIRSADVVAAYEVDPYTNTSVHAIATHVQVDNNEAPRQDGMGELESAGERRDLIGFPFLTSFDANFTCRQVWNHIWSQVRNMVGAELDSRNGSTRDDKTAADARDTRLRDLLRIRIVDNSGNPRPVFLDADMSDPSNGLDSSSILPPESDESIMTYLGKDCTERFLFTRLEWMDQSATSNDAEEGDDVSAPLMQKERFLSYVDHPSLAEALQKQRSLNGRKGLTLEQCFETFTRPERLDEHNMWYCSQCKEHVRAMKTMELWRLPNVLVVHLKRFEFKHALRREKLDTLVDFPLEGLDMSQHCASSSKSNSRRSGGDGGDMQDQVCFVEDAVPAIYDLFAVTNHYGRMGFGHYTAFARRWGEQGMSNDWALFDDSSVRSVGDGTGRNGGQGVVTPAAYVLFYRRRTFN